MRAPVTLTQSDTTELPAAIRVGGDKSVELPKAGERGRKGPAVARNLGTIRSP